MYTTALRNAFEDFGKIKYIRLIKNVIIYYF